MQRRVTTRDETMRLIGNILWLVFGGLWVFFEYIAAGVVLCLTIIGIPFGVQCFKLGVLAVWPFGTEVHTRRGSMSTLSVVMNVVWIILFGLVIALSHVVFAVLFALTIIGIPFAVQHIKLARLALTPFGLEVR